MGLSLIKATSAKVEGRSHRGTSLSCQDAVCTRNLRNKACIALADGAGSKKRSGTGANTVVKLATKITLDNFDYYFDEINKNGIEIRFEIAQRYQDEIKRKAARKNLPISEYACTLLFFAYKEKRYIAGHIGDGAIFTRSMRGIETFSSPCNGEYVNSTYFITDETAHMNLRLYSGEFEGNLDVMLLSDGAAESLLEKESLRSAKGVEILMDALVELPAKDVQKILKANLEQVISFKTTDDCSISMMTVLDG